ncbi:Hpt domain-containing protein [Quatrionicoccus australiensis]|uniref:Hpt domain-containing protein n=1 Tax=Quatrionicoccus australiensis TaxID=138118 RepID=UPI001CF85CAF|nr:Hpt domain-containing protein [Quatrionicoccus australiensis]UCV16519.1 Hpt domain-containing protein [Quatrionicoccus australiensis]
MTAAFKLDKAVILERLGGDEEIYTMMVDMFLQDVENNCTALAASLVAGEMPDLQREVHTVKGLLATFSDDAGAEEAQVIERQIKLGQTANLAEEIAALQARLREVAGVLGTR